MNTSTISLQPSTAAAAASTAPPPLLDPVRAAQFGHLDRLRQLVEECGDAIVLEPDGDGVTLLHWAAINNRRDIVSFLLKKGAVVDAVGGDLRSTPLHWATRQGVLGMVVLLLQNGADPMVPDVDGNACLHVAAQSGHTAIAAYLVAKGSDVNCQDKNGMTPLAWSAFRCSDANLSRTLLTLGASDTIPDHVHGNTALHWACTSGNLGVITVLVRRRAAMAATGATTVTTNSGRETPLDLLRKNSEATLKRLPKTVLEGLLEGDGDERKRGGLGRLWRDRRVRQSGLVVMPFVVFLTCGLIFQSDVRYLIKAALFLMVNFYVNFSMRMFSDEKISRKLSH